MIPYFNYKALYHQDKELFLALFDNIAERGAFIACEELHQFEEELARYAGCKYAVGVSDGTAAIIVALKAGGIVPGDEIIVCSHTMVATASACAWVGAHPVLVDCGEDHLIDPDKIEASITPRTRAVLPTQLNGRISDMDSLHAICRKHQLLLFEDAAQALGARYKNQSAGTFGVAGTISFYPAKTLGCFGDGGAILTNDEEVYRKIKLLRDHGRNDKGEVECWGLNSRLDNLQAAILLHKLKKYPQDLETRRSLAAAYHERLNDMHELLLPPAPDSGGERYDIYQNYEIEADRRDALKTFLAKEGVGTLIQWGGKAVHQWKGLGFNQSLPRTERLFERCIMLPMNTAVSMADVDYICEKIRKFYRTN